MPRKNSKGISNPSRRCRTLDVDVDVEQGPEFRIKTLLMMPMEVRGKYRKSRSSFAYLINSNVVGPQR